MPIDVPKEYRRSPRFQYVSSLKTVPYLFFIDYQTNARKKTVKKNTFPERWYVSHGSTHSSKFRSIFSGDNLDLLMKSICENCERLSIIFEEVISRNF